MPEPRRGMLMGVLAYVMWGAFPLYWPLLEPSGAMEILAHRVAWSALTMVVVIFALSRWRRILAIWQDRRKCLLLVVAAAVISVNWATYIWAVNSGRVVETSLGYFINPLVTVLMGVLVLGERLRRLQWVAMGIATAAVVVLTIDYGRPPWVALALALTFGSYGLAKKQANTGAMESLTVETMALAPVAVGFLMFLTVSGDATFGNHGAGHMALLALTGVITAVPLVLFGAAATSVSLVSLGLLQYLAPIIQFGIGVLYFGESMPVGRWLGFAIVWVALALFTAEALAHRRRQLSLIAHASAA